MSFSSNFKLDSTFSRCSKTNKRTTAEKYILASQRPLLRLVIDKLKLNVVENFTPHKQFFVETKIRRPLKPKMLTKSIVHWKKKRTPYLTTAILKANGKRLTAILKVLDHKHSFYSSVPLLLLCTCCYYQTAKKQLWKVQVDLVKY